MIQSYALGLKLKLGFNPVPLTRPSVAPLRELVLTRSVGLTARPSTMRGFSHPPFSYP
jgi:hypothetical protein